MGLFSFFRKKKNTKKDISLENTSIDEVITAEPIVNETEDSTKDEIIVETEAVDISAEDEAIEVEEDSLGENTVTESKPARTGKFEIKRAKDGRFHFNLYASNRVLIARSQVYSSSTKAMQGIKSVIANAPKAKIEDKTLKNPNPVSFPKWEIYLDNAEQYRFRLCASNGSCVCHSRGYTAKSSCKKGIESIIRFAEDAEINKLYLSDK